MAKLGWDMLRTLRGHTAHARYIAEIGDGWEMGGYIERQPDIPSPYRYSSEWATHKHPKDGRVAIVETSHRNFTVYKVS